MLDVRLTAAAELLSEGECLADIGSDHAYLPIHLLKEKKYRRAVVTDVNRGPLNNSEKNAARCGVEKRCDFRLGSGLTPLLAGECDAVSICGMGGDLIAAILGENLALARSFGRLVLQPMTNAAHLRGFLLENGFRIVEERMARDRHLFYQILSVRPDGEALPESDPFYLEFPLELARMRDAVFREYLLFKAAMEGRVLEGTRGSESFRAKEQAQRAQNRIHRLKELLQYYEGEGSH